MAYYDALDKAHTTEDYGDIVELIEKEVEASLDLYKVPCDTAKSPASVKRS
ncbi:MULTISPECIES: hypothetical protein [Lysinibacillus]|uniref:hypothetical protein n=1 Tax=Lysinibacillus TaxID=400634 RepID=UPI000A74293B|nr:MULTISPECIES: hypothetical protein [Lysinibacillus]UXJ68951.1 hypothetical protein N5069_23160 [Lysinibacillus fusiformis]WEA39343.1 hypothetical protein PWJ66_22565 [Lysinibacillus fusiformis]